jgi:hypothetical protein
MSIISDTAKKQERLQSEGKQQQKVYNQYVQGMVTKMDSRAKSEKKISTNRLGNGA